MSIIMIVVPMKPYKTIDSNNYMNDKVEIIILGRMGSGNHDRKNEMGISRYTDTLYWVGVVLILVFVAAIPWIWR